MHNSHKPRRLMNVIFAVSKVLCVVGGTCCFGLILGTAGAVDVAGDRDLHGWILQLALGVGGMAAFFWINGLIDREMGK